MRVAHELEKGVVCERCLKHTTKEDGYKRINVLSPVVEDTTGKYKTIYRMNLCKDCYKEYFRWLNNFIAKEGKVDGKQ